MSKHLAQRGAIPVHDTGSHHRVSMFFCPLHRRSSVWGTRIRSNAKVTLPVSGTRSGRPDVIVMHIDDALGTAVDPDRAGLLVVFNASGEEVTQAVPGQQLHAETLSSIQANGADEVVKGSRWDAPHSSAIVPARTVAVFERASLGRPPVVPPERPRCPTSAISGRDCPPRGLDDPND